MYFDNPLSAAALHLALWREGDAGGYPRQEYYGYGAPAPGAYAPPPYDY